MEQTFQTSFIPKKPIIEKRAVEGRPIGFFMIVAIFIFFTMLIATGGLYFYRTFLQKSVQSMHDSLNLAKNQFEPSKITQLQTLDKRLAAASIILSKHIDVSPIFEALATSTLKSIQYKKFDYSYSGDPTSKVKVQINGVATGYRAIALQADLFTDNKFMIDPVFSNLNLDEKGSTVAFDLNFSVDPSFVDYEQVIKTSSGTVKEVTNPNPVNNTSAQALPANTGAVN